MLDLIHSHWKRRRVCRVKCKGVPTVDMDNICRHIEVIGFFDHLFDCISVDEFEQCSVVIAEKDRGEDHSSSWWCGVSVSGEKL